MYKHTSYLSLGSNIGDSINYLNQAIKYLKTTDKIEVKKISAYYETPPYGDVEQQNFINSVVEIKTNLNPIDLLKECQRIEQLLNRERTIKWGPRTIDIDIILYDSIELNSDELVIPHPYAYDRAFVLVPLLEITNDDLFFSGKTIKEHLNLLDTNDIKKITSFNYEAICRVFPKGQKENEESMFAVVITRYKGKYVFVKNKKRNGYEIPGGKPEKDETIDEAAIRELKEETGAIKFDIEPYGMYYVKFGVWENYGKLYIADVFEFGDINSEIEKIDFFDSLPNNYIFEQHNVFLDIYENNVNGVDKIVKKKFMW